MAVHLVLNVLSASQHWQCKRTFIKSGLKAFRIVPALRWGVFIISYILLFYISLFKSNQTLFTEHFLCKTPMQSAYQVETTQQEQDIWF